ncbi:MAG TPA: hypothetical protein VK815_01195 [Candidatus Acidoferrales bacterium]|jgi:hypothetical protein|nr:hypothetical protein [Candidatus Acidoferrales bacterium]
MKTPMQIRLNKTSLFVALAAAAMLSISPTAKATNYAGNGSTDFGGAVGNGVLTVSDDHTNITVNLQRGSSGNLDNLLVIYIDTGAGGPTDTSGFTSAGGDEQRAISGFDGGGNRSLLTFTNGFTPHYAVAIKSDYMDLWALTNTGNFNIIAGTGQGGDNSGNFTLTFQSSQIGLAPNVTSNIRILGTFISNTGYRSREAIAGNVVGGASNGWHPFTNTAFATYTFSPTVVPTYAVTFTVDMTEQAQLGNFVPGTDPVYCGGSFQTNPFAFNDFSLVQSNNSDIYTNTYLTTDLTNTVEAYKFKFHSVANNSDSYDSDPNRTFTLQGSGQLVPTVYFDNYAATPSATTNYLYFSIDMGPQIYLGHFNPGAGDLIQVYGSFEQPKWSGTFPPIGFLTNNPTLSGNASNIYSGTFADGNYPSTVSQYKYVIAPGGTGSTYEDGANRLLTTSNGATVLPLAYFNGVNTYASNNITFSVDMTVPIMTGQLNPANNDTVGCAGTFQTNSFGVADQGFTLTNNPTLNGNASNIFSGTYVDRNQPGSTERYKFVINPAGAGPAIFEQPASTGGGDRTFGLGTTASTNPLVLWGDRTSNDVVLVDTTLTFHVNMTNATDRWGVPFNPDTDRVMVDGDFTSPQYPLVSHPADATIELDYPGHLMNRDTDTGLTYSLSFDIPAGNPIEVTYKYGILRNAGTFSNTNIDNEGGFAQNHVRFIRTSATGSTYDFALDNFGQPRTDPAGATEQLFGNLSLGSLAGGNFPINWTGVRGVHLQSSTNLVGGWTDLNATDGTSMTNLPVSPTGQSFYRLVKP